MALIYLADATKATNSISSKLIAPVFIGLRADLTPK